MANPRESILLMPCISYMGLGALSPMFSQLGLYSIRSYVLQFPEIAARFGIDYLPWRSLDAVSEHWDVDKACTQLLHEILCRRPRAVGFSLYLWTIGPAHDLALQLKQVAPEILVVAGGPEVSDRTGFAAEFPAFDILVEGDGELPFRRFLERLGPGPADLSGIPNLSFRAADGQWVHNAPSCETEDESRLPNVFADHPDEIGETAFYLTTRGCVFRCTYCLWAHQPLRGKSISRLIAEVETIVRTGGVKRLMFFDYDLLDLASKDPDSFAALRDVMMRNGRPLTTFFTRPSAVADPNLASLIADLNVDEVFLGVQSLNPAALRAVRRPWQVKELADLPKAPRWLLPKVTVQMMVPLPQETPESFYDGLERLIAMGYHHVQTFPVLALRGTALRADAAAHGVRYLTTPPYACYETDTFPREEVLTAISVASVLKSLTLGVYRDQACVDRLERFFGSRPRLIREIREAVREPDGLRRIEVRLLRELWGPDPEAARQGGAKAPSAATDPVPAPEPAPATDGSPVPDTLPRQTFPPAAALRAVVERHGLTWSGERQDGSRLELSATLGGAGLIVTLFPADLPDPAYGQAGNLKVAYRGTMSDLRVINDLLEVCRQANPAV